jgi:hypothetical protein
MIELLDTVVLPNLGAYRAGDIVKFGRELERQLIAAGKAKKVGDETDSIVASHVTGFGPGVTDD